MICFLYCFVSSFMKWNHFSSEILFLGNFYRHLAIFFWSHWPQTIWHWTLLSKLLNLQCLTYTTLGHFISPNFTIKLKSIQSRWDLNSRPYTGFNRITNMLSECSPTYLCHVQRKSFLADCLGTYERGEYLTANVFLTFKVRLICQREGTAPPAPF